MSGNHGPGYLPHVDGLRAIAILSVVAYHAGIPGVSGGFVGVDIFFVISGYLIIKQLLTGIGNGTFTFAGFWARRVLRILPGYLLVVAATAIAGFFIVLVPNDLRDMGWQVTYASLMAINHLFVEQQGYFDLASERKPLLHLWSLSVEEQFYLASPLAMVLVHLGLQRLPRTALTDAIKKLFWLGIFALSLYLCITLTKGDVAKAYGFYLMPARIWAFMAGGVLSTLSMDRWHRCGGVLSAAGLAMICAAVFGIDSAARYPSYLALLPVSGAVLMIAGGLANPANPFAAFLASRSMVGIGLVSYAWYLWHWPALTLARIANFDALPLWLGLAMAGLSFGLAVATYLCVEKPIRQMRGRTGIANRWSTVLAGLASCAVLVGAGALIRGPVAGQVDANLPILLTSPSQDTAGVCWISGNGAAKQCRAAAKGEPIVLLLGDSHAKAQVSITANLAKDAGRHVALVSAPGCIGLFDVEQYNKSGDRIRRYCIDRNKRTKPAITSHLGAESAILVSRWQFVTGREGLPSRLLGPVKSGPATDQAAFFVKSMRNTIATLKTAGVQRILVIGPTPEYPFSAPDCLLRARSWSIDPATRCMIPRTVLDTWQSDIKGWLGKGVTGIDGVRLLDPTDAFCTKDRCVPYAANGQILYGDDDHLNTQGVQQLYKYFASDFDWLLGKQGN